MTTPKCPLCGETPQFATKDIDGIEMCQILCKCGLATEANWYWLNSKDDPEEDELRAWKDWEKLVSKFPPIMRLKQGDNVMLYDRELCAVHSVNLKYNRVVLQNCRADIMVETADKIEKWPWELEQKGGDEQ